ncbi:penicillin-binding protein 2 [Porphyrobacter algicida]|uniref:Penicillin-binding protein 2 n=1 Tax=Qipengyuania algicida TaxID=1836209 RepID=A0A845AFD1_9SPHN|nr:penicillin-binding protein 2 [Qipengyuania algicida]MXP27505.1 penicillin-binding protein 2 [Qipengyuania algicida]
MGAFLPANTSPPATLSVSRIQLVTLRQKAMELARQRILWVTVGFLFVAIVAVLRIGFLGMSDRSVEATSFEESLLPPRGEIVDRNGVPLARAFPAYALWFDPNALGKGGSPLIKPPAEVARELKAIFPDLDVAKVTQLLASGKPGYIRRRVLPEQANKVQDIGELALEMPREMDRQYPQGSLAAHVLGYVGANGHGHVGMEEVLDKQLRNPATRGTPAQLSIDVRVQGALEDELIRGMRLVNAKGAGGIVLDVNTGEVLALASLPEFDPNHIDAEGEKNMFNRMTNQVYELGSTFKPITVAAALDAGLITDMGKRYPATPLHIGGFTIHDDENFGASLNVPEMLIHSSNIVAAEIADELGPDRMKRTMEKLHMNERPFIELPARGFPIWPSGKWARIRAMTVGFGHGVAVTPLHLASAYAALVNGGIWRPATLHKLPAGDQPSGQRVFKPSTSARVRQLLRMIALYGTGRSANAPGFRIGGKTGTAEMAGKGGYRRHSVIATFASAFPMDNPRYVVLVMLDEPQGTLASSYQRTAAWNAAPIVGRLVPRIGPMLGVQPDTTHDIDISELKPLLPEAQQAAKDGQ